MKKLFLIVSFLFLTILAVTGCVTGNRSSVLDDTQNPVWNTFRLWYQQPAKAWTEALPVGNGRLGAMVFGSIDTERIQLNEDTVWAGPPLPQPNPEMREAMNKARKLWFAGDYKNAQKILSAAMSTRISPRSYQTLGDIRLKFNYNAEDVQQYQRQLNLDTAIALTSFTVNNIRYQREVFVSPVDDVVVVHLSADKPGQLSFAVALDRPESFKTRVSGNDTLIMSGQAQHKGKNLGVKWCAHLKACLHGGSVHVDNKVLHIAGADSVTLYLAAATDYNKDNPEQPLLRNSDMLCKQTIALAAGRKFADLRRDHINEHRRLFRRCLLDLGTSEIADQPTDRRLLAVKKGIKDPALTALYFQYGRYLLICSSRPGSMPANLQGIWNDKIAAPWNSDYHTNINLQMNYWLADTTNLSECHKPFFDFIERLVPSGQRTARIDYGCRGFVVHHTTDAWLCTVPVKKLVWGMWPHGGAWCTRRFIDYYRFTGDRVFLRERAYPILKQASLFYLDYLVVHPETHKLVSGLDTSPENQYLGPDGKRYSVSMGCAMSQQIVYAAFANTLEAARILGINNDFISDVRKALDNLAEPVIASDGRLQEWALPFKEPAPGHRHMSHLFALYPGKQYTMRSRPDMVAAARKSIEYRLSHGGGHTGWSRAWIINFFARFCDGDKAWENIIMLLKKSTLSNLFDNHPPFQIDGNFGAAAGIAQMLVQSHQQDKDGNYIVELLPALPGAWSGGSVKGLCARNGFVVDMDWHKGVLTKAVIHSRLGRVCVLCCAGKTVTVKTKKGKAYIFDGNLNLKEK